MHRLEFNVTKGGWDITDVNAKTITLKVVCSQYDADFLAGYIGEGLAILEKRNSNVGMRSLTMNEKIKEKEKCIV